MKEVYVVIMYRWGVLKNHNYLLGVFDDKDEAIKWGMKEHSERGGKYDPYVIKSQLNGFKVSRNNYANVEILEKEYGGKNFYIPKDGTDDAILQLPIVKNSHVRTDTFLSRLFSALKKL